MVVRREHSPPSVYIIGVSIPRSGHNFLVRILTSLFPLDLFYCEYYGVAGCCQAVPCARRGALPITFQKTHDFELDVPSDVPGALYVILHRGPVPVALSARELYADDYGEEVAGDRGEYAVWLGRQAEYYVTFAERWLQQPPSRSLVIAYDDLARDPTGTLEAVLAAAGLAADERAIREAVAKTVPRGGLHGERPYVPRSIEKSRYLDRELVGAYESIVADSIPGLAAGRVLDPVEYRDTLTWRVFEALRALRGGNAEAGIGLLDRAIETAPDNALLHHERAVLLQEQRQFGEAWQSAERAMRLFPTHRPILEAAVTVALAAGDPSAVVEPMERLHALSEPTLLGRLRLALVRTHGGDDRAADVVLDEVRRVLPDDVEVWRTVSEIRRTRGELDAALVAIETTIRLAPLQGEPYAYRGELLLDVGRTGEAVEALQAALVIDARQHDWWTLLLRANLAAGDDAGALATVQEALQQFPDDAELLAELDRLRQCVPESDATSVRQDSDLVRLRIELAQLRTALGTAERRSYELEVRGNHEASRLDEAMQEAWARASRLEESMHAAWEWAQKVDARARRLRAALEELDVNAPVIREKWF